MEQQDRYIRFEWAVKVISRPLMISSTVWTSKPEIVKMK